MTKSNITKQTSIEAELATNPSMWVDRNIIYNIALIADKEDPIVIDLVFFLLDMFQTKSVIAKVSTHGADALLQFTIDEFAKWSQQSKASLTRKADNDWSYTIHIGQDQTPLTVTSRLDKALYFLANNQLNASQFIEMYKYKINNPNNTFQAEDIMVSMKAPSVIEKYWMNIAEDRSKKRTYLVKLNSFVRHSVISENLAYIKSDLPKLRGKGPLHFINFKLLSFQNSAITKYNSTGKNQIYQLTYQEMKDLCLVEVTGYSYKQNISREKKRINAKLDYLNKNTQLNFTYSIGANNTYYFKFIQGKSQLLPHSFKIQKATQNNLRTFIADFIDGLLPKSLSDLSLVEQNQFLDKLIETYDFNKRLNPEYHQSFVQTITNNIQSIDFTKDQIESKIKERNNLIIRGSK